jgi:hypothetical protein
MPIRHSTAVEIQLVQNPQRIGRESVTTAFVPGESGFVDHGDLVTEAMQGGGTSGSGWACPNDEDPMWRGCEHGMEAMGRSGYVGCDTSS